MDSVRYVAVEVPGISTFARDVVRGAHAYTTATSGTELFLNLEVNKAAVMEQLRQIVHKMPLAGIVAEIWNRRILEMTKFGVPVVEVTGTWADTDVPSVHTDDVALGRMVAEYLLGKGLKSYAYSGVPAVMHSRLRQRAFVRMIQDAGHACSVWEWAFTEAIQIASYAPSLAAWLRSLPKPVGIMCWMDGRAQEIIHVCRKEGLRIPDDVMLVGVGNDEMTCEMTTPKITSVDLNGQRIGYAAMELLDRLIVGETPGEPVLIAPGRMVERESSRGSAIAHSEVAEAVRFIEQHIERPLAVGDILSHVQISRRALESHFARLFNRSPREHIRHLQMERAKVMLSQTSASIQEIARRSGFAGPAAFCATFRRLNDTTPGEYRQRHRRGQLPA